MKFKNNLNIQCDIIMYNMSTVSSSYKYTPPHSQEVGYISVLRSGSWSVSRKLRSMLYVLKKDKIFFVYSLHHWVWQGGLDLVCVHKCVGLVGGQWW